MSDNTALIEWSRNTNFHDSVPAPDKTRRSTASIPFILILHELEGSQVPMESLQFSITFYKKSESTFFGRTFVFGQELVVYYHTTITDEDVEAVCEILEITQSANNVIGRKPIGWTRLICFKENEGQKSPLYSGSLRNLTISQNPLPKPGYFLNYEIRPYEELRLVYGLLPPDTFCGPHEILPGVAGRYLPSNPAEHITLGPTASLFLKNIEIPRAQEIEDRIKSFAEAWRKEAFGVDSRPVRINELRVTVGLHNSWHYLGGGGPESVAFLKRTEDSFVASTLITLRDAAIDPLIAIVFELECALEIPKPNAPGEMLKVALAWAPHLNFREGDYNAFMIPGPGRSVSGKMLWGVSLDIQVFFNLSMKEGAAPIVQTQYITSIKEGNPEDDLRYRQEQANMLRKIQQLEAELQKARTQTQAGPQLIPIKPPPSSPPQLTQIQSIEIRPSLTQTVPRPVTTPIMQPQYPPQNMQSAYDSNVDFSYIDAIAPVPLNGQRPETSFSTMPLDMPRALSRADKARLVRAGIRGLMDNEEFAGVRPRLDIEAQDPLKAANFVIQFLAYRPPVRGSRMPSRVCFGVRFYVFPHNMTEPVTIKTGEAGVPWVLEKDGPNPELLMKFEVEPPVWDQVDFAKYLMKKSLSIEVWNAESHIHIGNARINLIEVVRQGKASVVSTKEYPVFDENKEQIGSLQILLRNQGMAPSVRLQPSQDALKLTGPQARHKHKVRSKVLVPLPDEKPIAIDNEDQRKRLRIMEFRKSQTQQIASEDWDKEKQLKEISIIRESRKPLAIKQALREYMSTAEKIHARVGQAFTFQYMLRNPQIGEECFSVIIEDKELSVVKDVSEWQWWVNHFNYDRPLEYDMITPDNSIILRPGESCPIIFKFISWNPQPKMITAWIHQSKGSPICAMELEVVPESSPVDQVLRFYECENRTVKLAIPPLYSSETLTKPILHCSLDKAIVQWENEREISVELKTPAAPNILSFNLVAYDDPYCSEVVANWEIKLHSLVGVDINVTMGQSTAIRLACPGDEARTVALYSSKEDCVFFPSPHDKPFTLLPRSVNSLPVMIRSDSPQIQRVRVHCVDIFHRQLVHAWVIRIESSAATITQIYEVKCKLGQPTDKRVLFVNRSQTWAIFHFRSSHPNVLEIKEPRISLEGGAKGYLWVHVPATTQPNPAEVCVFATDSEENIFECLLFKIDYE